MGNDEDTGYAQSQLRDMSKDDSILDAPPADVAPPILSAAQQELLDQLEERAEVDLEALNWLVLWDMWDEGVSAAKLWRRF